MNEKRRGVGFLGLLALLFIGLKLGGIIHWSWWWVLAPIWGPMALFGGFALGAGAVMWLGRQR